MKILTGFQNHKLTLNVAKKSNRMRENGLLSLVIIIIP